VDYISTNAVHMINISSACREQLILWYTGLTSTTSNNSTSNETLHNLFNEAQREIFNLICSDSFLRFMRTPECQKIQQDFNSHYLFGLRTQNSRDSSVGNSEGHTNGGSQRNSQVDLQVVP